MFCKSASYGITILLGCLIGVFVSSCENNRLDVDVSDIHIKKVTIERFDQDFFSLNAENISQKLPELQKKYRGFTDLFIKNIICLPENGITDSSCVPEIIRFINNNDMHKAFEDCQKNFPDMTMIETELTAALRHYKYYYPHARLPNAVAMMSGFNYSIITADSTFAIGLEMYLGKKNEFYDMIRFPNYRRTTMQKAYITRDFIRALTIKVFPGNTKSGTLLNEMIYQGKLLYFMDAMMPNGEDSIKIGFTKMQLEWCEENEGNIWGHLIKNKLLYSNEVEVVSKFTGEGPFTTGFVKESPARTGGWIGWKIVKKYMDKNPNISLDQLMLETEAQKILSFSKYKP